MMTRVGGTAPPAPGNEIVVVSGRSERDAGLYEPDRPLVFQNFVAGR